MKINKIELYNIGSYEGLNVFDILDQRETGKISVIGGKNGAGKTTLFTSIKLCLYGYKEAGYQSINSYYKRSIKKLINDKAKVENNPEAYVILDLSIFNGQDWDIYKLKRTWKIDSDNFESFEVIKNDRILRAEEIDDFDNYLLNIIPPELFELYFFDGEQIADFFLDDTSGERIKKAFLTICGYDTFDIIYKNFKRLSKESGGDNDVLKRYFLSEEELNEKEKALNSINLVIEKFNSDIEATDSELSGLEKKYASAGGVSIEEWNQNFLTLKNEERIREEKNLWLKSAANEKIPYLILNQEINEVLNQMNKEQDIDRNKVLLDAVQTILPGILDEVCNTTPGFSKTAKDRVLIKLNQSLNDTNSQDEGILNLSKQEYQLLTNQIMNLLSFEKSEILSVRKEIKDSVKRSQKMREKIESSSISNIEEFLNNKEQLLSQKSEMINEREQKIEAQKIAASEYEKAQVTYKLAEKELEKYLKNASINDLTAKSIVFLDTLQKRLFKSEIEKVESLFMDKMNQLMRKEQFISNIVIDDNFGIHVYKKVSLDTNKICQHILETSNDEYIKEYGIVHCDDLLRVTKSKNLEDFVKNYKGKAKLIDVNLEFDKQTMSKGEKQVFIMALYWSIMELCNKEVPFIIDTPFARIDTEHRAHITEYFFKELKGQVFIFSTDEEITEEHLKVIGNDLQSTFLIENIDNTKTLITSNSYFGGK